MPTVEFVRPARVLLVEDNPIDARLIVEALQARPAPSKTAVVDDGIEALAYLRRKGKYAGAARPDLVLLDLNLPRKHGHDVLAEVKSDDELSEIPVVVLSTSGSQIDIFQAYQHHANSYVTKPVKPTCFVSAIHAICDFWLGTATLPGADRSDRPLPAKKTVVLRNSAAYSLLHFNAKGV